MNPVEVTITFRRSVNADVMLDIFIAWALSITYRTSVPMQPLHGLDALLAVLRMFLQMQRMSYTNSLTWV